MMTYIAPNTTITFFRSTGLTPNYENTLYFATEQEKNLYFANWSAGAGTQVGIISQSYQRENRNFCRVQITMAQLYNCDYMRFVNVNYENKVFYAFVTAINYINNNCTEVEYSIDPLMTWMGTFTLRQCWIERQHTTSDEIGGNVVGENLGINGYVEEGTEYSDDWGRDNCTIRLQYANPDEAKPNTWGGIYNPTTFVDSNAAGIANAISGNGGLVDQDLVDNIVNVYMVPTDFANPGSVHESNFTVGKPYSTVDGYAPKNKKLFCFPYKYMLVDNSEGSQKQFYYEYFGGTPKVDSSGSSTCLFRIYGTSVNSVEVDLLPVNYNGHSGSDMTNRLVMSHFPVCAWTYDTYEAYLAQKNAYLTHDAVTAGVNGFINGVAGQAGSSDNYDTVSYKQPTTISGSTNLPQLPGPEMHPTVTAQVFNPMHMLASGALGAGTNFSRVVADNTIDNLIRPEAGSTVRGSGNSDIPFQADGKKFTFHKMCINSQNARMIDDYFTLYGYAIKNLGTPNMNARPHWTYVKTVGCNVDGSLPASDKATIENIFDKGTRFWHSLTEMGNYSLDNSPA